MALQCGGRVDPSRMTFEALFQLHALVPVAIDGRPDSQRTVAAFASAPSASLSSFNVLSASGAPAIRLVKFASMSFFVYVSSLVA
jgi:hypothetical protein